MQMVITDRVNAGRAARLLRRLIHSVSYYEYSFGTKGNCSSERLSPIAGQLFSLIVSFILTIHFVGTESTVPGPVFLVIMVRIVRERESVCVRVCVHACLCYHARSRRFALDSLSTAYLQTSFSSEFRVTL